MTGGPPLPDRTPPDALATRPGEVVVSVMAKLRDIAAQELAVRERESERETTMVDRELAREHDRRLGQGRLELERQRLVAGVVGLLLIVVVAAMALGHPMVGVLVLTNLVSIIAGVFYGQYRRLPDNKD